MNTKTILKKLHIDISTVYARIGLGIMIGAFVAAIAWYQLVIKPRFDTIETLKNKSNQLQVEINKLQALEPKLDQMRKEIEISRIKLDSLRTIFPDQKEIPKLLKTIAAQALSSGIVTNRFVPLPDVEKEFYIENRFAVRVKGGFHELGTFYSALANLPLIINLTEVKIEMYDKVDKSIKDAELYGSPIRSLMASFTLTTFSSKRSSDGI